MLNFRGVALVKKSSPASSSRDLLITPQMEVTEVTPEKGHESEKHPKSGHLRKNLGE